ncbi:MAG: DUF6869 domain-containing protein [Pyrinomonadaceae bacterium]
MNEVELQKIVDAWIAAEDAEEGADIHGSKWWAVSQVLDWALEDQPELLWRFILTAYKRELSDKASAVLAAGPLEDLLSKFGPDYIDRVEELVVADDQFNWLLGGVWRLDMTDEVWARVQSARHEVW